MRRIARTDHPEGSFQGSDADHELVSEEIIKKRRPWGFG
jgi:hypothetical protein